MYSFYFFKKIHFGQLKKYKKAIGNLSISLLGVKERRGIMKTYTIYIDISWFIHQTVVFQLWNTNNNSWK